MYMLRIEHPVPNFDGWKKAFDSDPVDREKSGVRRYQILRPPDDANVANQICGLRVAYYAPTTVTHLPVVSKSP
jgi:hypothetical protein